jgi:hypothetical protein
VRHLWCRTLVGFGASFARQAHSRRRILRGAPINPRGSLGYVRGAGARTRYRVHARLLLAQNCGIEVRVAGRATEAFATFARAASVELRGIPAIALTAFARNDMGAAQAVRRAAIQLTRSFTSRYQRVQRASMMGL